MATHPKPADRPALTLADVTPGLLRLAGIYVPPAARATPAVTALHSDSPNVAAGEQPY